MSLAAATAPVLVNDPRLTFEPDDHRYTLNGRDLISVTTALLDARMVDTTHWQEQARLRGQYLHAAIALHAEGDLDLDTIDPRIANYFDGFLAFLHDTRVTIEHCERRVCDPSLGYAGTFDAIVRWLGAPLRRTLIDWKSGWFPPMAAPQTAAYLRCARYLYPAGTLIGRAGLHLRADGTYRLVPFTDIVQDEQDFLAALRVATFRRRHGIY